MNFELTEEQVMIQGAAKQFAQGVLAPQAAALDLTSNPEIMKSHLKQLAEQGFMGVNIAGEYGGTEAGTIAFSLAITELARACASTAVAVSVSNMVAELIQAIGSDAQKNDYLPRLCSGEFAAGSFCLTETEAGSDPAAMKTRAVKEADAWVLNGSKVWISTAALAGVFVVWAVTNPDAPKGKGISCFLVKGDTAGITVAKPEKKMGQKGSGTHEVIFENCRIPLDALIGEENQGFKIAVTELCGGRIGIASLALGVAGAALDYARDYVQERKQFGKPLAEFQGLQWMLVENYTEMEAARLLIMQAAALKDAGKPFAVQASMAKLMATEKGNKACYDALQLLGANGYMQDFPLERYARDIRVTSIYEGTSEIQKVIIARSLFSH
ncbi:MAG TPA: acyl-CoA dehydrogenase family protein [Marinospirillum sp.]|uniref:acyl-CoA dehydrogenase family protein n=1 Tax=Marinospirillum sp. TaxID=2183934 RepID=UPI002B464182|nr:acyl-CoA dehydrogenase family protein [Marinospirillum sp.]HKM14313.1 acyl-CoA dehydrogenase family protein [Marinospirillum sp.]